jgi:hypothetical protein
MGNTCKPLCVGKWQMSHINFNKLPVFESNAGQEFRKMEFQLEMMSVSNLLNFTVYHDGK